MRDFITSIKRTPYQSLGSFLILFFTLFLALFFFTIISFFHGMLSYVETRPQVIAYFDVKAKEDEIITLKEQIEKTGKTSSVIYVSQNAALKIYKDLNQDNPLLLEMVSANILPASLEIFATKPVYLSELAEFLQNQPLVDEVNYQKSIVDRLVALTNILRQVTIALLLLLFTITVTVLITTTAFKISLKREEIEVLQLIGASKRYIRRPFINEGMIFGFLSGTVAFVLFYGIFFYFQPFLKTYLTGIPKLSIANLEQFNIFVFPPSLEFIVLSYGLIIFFGAAIGFIGNYLATSKYIK
ncbi:permease-like cell division protein FtsX [Candidatus Woesebacteria bacterium]|nr:permease-like cell division protein FtsX [Candidatus Woesebacteria bacterium]